MKTRTAGFTLIETLVAMLILGIGFTLVSSALFGNLSINTKSDNSTQASAVALQQLDRLRRLDPASTAFPSQGKQNLTVQDANGKSWPVVITYCFQPALCSNSSRNVLIEIMDGQKVAYSTETVYTQLFYEADK